MPDFNFKGYTFFYTQTVHHEAEKIQGSDIA